MKTLLKTLTLPIILSVSLLGCSKKSSTTPSTATTWTISGTNYKGTVTGFTSGALVAVDNQVNTDPEISIQFSATPAAGSYTVISQLNNSSGLSATQCYINTTDVNANLLYSDMGGTVNVTVNSGKITASFANIPMGILKGDDPNTGEPIFDAAGTTSGTLVEQ